MQQDEIIEGLKASIEDLTIAICELVNAIEQKTTRPESTQENKTDR